VYHFCPIFETTPAFTRMRRTCRRGQPSSLAISSMLSNFGCFLPFIGSEMGPPSEESGPGVVWVNGLVSQVGSAGRQVRHPVARVRAMALVKCHSLRVPLRLFRELGPDTFHRSAPTGRASRGPDRSQPGPGVGLPAFSCLYPCRNAQDLCWIRTFRNAGWALGV
jgi:hypothetical protein